MVQTSTLCIKLNQIEAVLLGKVSVNYQGLLDKTKMY